MFRNFACVHTCLFHPGLRILVMAKFAVWSSSGLFSVCGITAGSRVQGNTALDMFVYRLLEHFASYVVVLLEY